MLIHVSMPCIQVLEGNQGAVERVQSPITNLNSNALTSRTQAGQARLLTGGQFRGVLLVGMCGFGCVPWFLGRQKAITVSTTEPKYVAVVDVIEEVPYLKAGLALHDHSCQHAVRTGVRGRSRCGGTWAEPFQEL